MSDTLRLDVHVRENVVKKDLLQLRKSGKIPGEVYGHGFENVHVAVDAKAFDQVYRKVGESSLVDLSIDGKQTEKVLIHDLQRDGQTLRPIHVDFYRVRMDEKVRASVPFEFVGVSPAVKTHGAVIVTVKDALEVECLPAALPSKIIVDLSKLQNIDDRLQVSDLSLPEGLKVLDSMDASIVAAEAPRSEEELAALETAVVENVEAVEAAKPKKETEEEVVAAPEAAGKPEAKSS
ncbi:MAG: 50S ribosomal protein L25 [Candidatus Kerfeldbacteria bacterium]|nr:50S ribosomal protein L25 [Candidatus Kerfeldbacteria bacterium]